MEYTFKTRLDALRQKKQEQTQEKVRRNGSMDEDDYGCVPPPEDFVFYPECNDPENHTFYGAELWGRNYRRLMEAHPVYVDKNDVFAGRWMFILQRMRPFEGVVSDNNLEMAPVFDYNYLKPTIAKYSIVPGIGKMHHFGGDYQIGLDLGWYGLLDKVRRYAQTARDEEAAQLYQAEENVLLGIINWIERTLEEIGRLEAEEDHPQIKANLHRMYQTNAWILRHPARDLYEACQWICWYNMAERIYCRAGAGCQLDKLLLPYYNVSKDAGMSQDEAVFLLACFLLNDPHYYQLGGPSADGSDNTNPLSYLILEAAHQLKSTANLTIRVFDGMDEGLFRRGLEILFEDRLGFPRFSGDKALVEGFMRNGFSAETARQRIALGCNWMSLAGTEYSMSDLIKINMAKVFEVAFQEYQGENTQELYDLFCLHMEKAMDCVRQGIDFHMRHQYQNAPELLLNLISHGPIEKGRDASHGGLQYYNIAVDGAGIAVVADSFAALQTQCQQKKRLQWAQVKKACQENFSGAEGEIIRNILHNTPMFGSGGSLADEWALRISQMFAKLVAEKPTPDGYRTIPGLFSWANTIPFGKVVGATPNGRYAGTPINHGANPNNGFRKDGAFTAAARAIAAIQPGYGNTAPFQLELNDTITNRQDAIENVGAIIKAHFDLGGTLVNINIVDADQILQANENPEAYPNLIVRVTGFTAYFSALSPEFRQLVVDRIISDR